jgi:hypothetical protein
MSYLPNPEEAIPHKCDQIRSLRYQNYQPGAVFFFGEKLISSEPQSFPR